MRSIFARTVGPENADFIGTTQAAIQAAVDQAASSGGGTVKILPGTYIMNDSLHLRSGVTVCGSGSGTVLMKSRCVQSRTRYYLGYGHFDVSVDEPEKFAIGSGVMVTDDDSSGFLVTVATVVGKQGHELILSKPLNHDYNANRNGRVLAAFPVISGEYLDHACVKDLTVAGNSAENEPLDGCRGGGIYLLQADNVEISQVIVTDYHGDGISFQQCRNTVIERCACTDNTGHGFHPGSGSVGLTIRESAARKNGVDGIFFCLRVSFALIDQCDLSENGQDGISIGHRDTDSLIRMNRMEYNRRNGIYFRPDGSEQTGSRTLITGNSFRGNGRQAGSAAIFIGSSVMDLHILGNVFNEDIAQAKTPEKSPEMAPEKTSERACLPIYSQAIQNSMVVFDNKPEDRVVSSADDPQNGISYGRPAHELQIGPEYADSSRSLHLGADKTPDQTPGR